jgi:SagB-type dehydrogenase family enzyme
MPALRVLILMSVLAASAAAAAPAAVETPAIALPAPHADGAVSVEQALATRRSVRGMAERPLTLAEVGQLCWAAQGITDDQGHRTAPSAMATYPLEVYVIADAVADLGAGIYRYQPAGHALVVHAGTAALTPPLRDALVAKVVGQDWIKTAPAILVITGTAERMGERFVDRRHDFMCVEAGLAAQGFFLQATALGLCSTYVGGFDPAAARAFLELPAGEEVLAVLPVGARPGS